MRNKFLSLMPEFQLISDAELQENCLQVWLEAIQKGDWEIEDLRAMPGRLPRHHSKA